MLADNSEYRQLLERAVDVIPVGMVVLHRSGEVILFNAAARELFGLRGVDTGRPFDELEMSERPVELRSAVERVQKEQVPLVIEQVVPTDHPDRPDCFEIHVVPVTDGAGTVDGVVLTFIDVSASHRPQDQREDLNADRRTAYEALQTAHEELNATTGPLQTAIDELQVMDETLRLTNEELETMNAELHSTKEELQALGDELRLRTAELREVNGFLESLLISQRGAVVLVDRDLRISIWNDRSAELWGLRSDEAPGQHFLNIDIGLPVEELREPLRSILAGQSGGEAVELDASDRRGREFRCRVAMTPLVNRAGEIRGVILVMEEP